MRSHGLSGLNSINCSAVRLFFDDPLEWLRGERYYRTFFVMIVRSVRHRGLRRLIEDDNPRFLRQNLVDRVRKILTALILAEHIDGFITDAPPGWRIHRLSGERQDEWSISVPTIGGSRLKKRTATSTA